MTSVGAVSAAEVMPRAAGNGGQAGGEPNVRGNEHVRGVEADHCSRTDGATAGSGEARLESQVIAGREVHASRRLPADRARSLVIRDCSLDAGRAESLV